MHNIDYSRSDPFLGLIFPIIQIRVSHFWVVNIEELMTHFCSVGNTAYWAYIDEKRILEMTIQGVTNNWFTNCKWLRDEHKSQMIWNSIRTTSANLIHDSIPVYDETKICENVSSYCPITNSRGSWDFHH